MKQVKSSDTDQFSDESRVTSNAVGPYVRGPMAPEYGGKIRRLGSMQSLKQLRKDWDDPSD